MYIYFYVCVYAYLHISAAARGQHQVATRSESFQLAQTSSSSLIITLIQPESALTYLTCPNLLTHCHVRLNLLRRLREFGRCERVRASCDECEQV